MHFTKNEFQSNQIKNCITVIAFNMNMNRFVFTTVEKERKSEESEYFWHGIKF